MLKIRGSIMALLAVLFVGLPALAQAGITSLSGPPEYVSGGAVRLQIQGPADAELTAVNTIGAGGLSADLSAQFTRVAPGFYEGVLRDLPEGSSTVLARIGGELARITVTNHPQTGPMFAGAKQEVFLCASDSHRGTAQLGDILDSDCSMDTRVDFLYMSLASGNVEPYDPDTTPASDVALTTTLDGSLVPFIVRWERGTINRFIYSIAMLSPESQSLSEPDLSGWNRRALFQFQGGVAIGHYQGGPSMGNMLSMPALGLGYAVLYSTGNRTNVHYDLILGGETAMMVKSRFITEYGVPDYTVAIGGSGGAIQQYVYAQNHPGLLDALIPQYSYPDMVTQTIHVGDCELLERWIDFQVMADPESKWATWTNRTLIEGLNASNEYPNPFTGEAGNSECINGWRGLSPLALNPHFGTAPGVTPEQQASVEWTHFADAVNSYGLRPDGYARRTWDNVGVQYGLQAVADGSISPEEFLHLNATVGSWKDQSEMVQEGCPFVEQLCEDPEQIDPWSMRNMNLSPDGGITPAARAEADPGAIRAVLESGLVFLGDIDVPVIDWRPYLEEVLDMHNTSQSFASRQRMLDVDGDASNQVIWFTDVVPGQDEFDQTPMALRVMDEWMARLQANPGLSAAQARPEAAVDSCFNARGDLIYAGDDAWAGVLDDSAAGPCTEQFELYSTSRRVAGAPVTGIIYKCHLQSVESAIASGIYGDWQPDAAETARLNQIFPSGVCDYTLGEAGWNH